MSGGTRCSCAPSGTGARRSPRPAAGIAAFTLLELLIVISIIALLVGLLLPTFMLARAQARLLLCQTRLRAQAQAHAMYAEEYADRKPPLAWKYRSATYWQWTAPNTRWDAQSVGQGILVAGSYLAFEGLLCPDLPMADDNLIDREHWQETKFAGSSYQYFWRHPSSLPAGRLEPSETGGTYEYAVKTRRAGLAMDINAEGTHPFTGAFVGRPIQSHPLLRRVNVSYIGGVVLSHSSDLIGLVGPGGVDEQLQWWDQAHALFGDGAAPTP